MNHFLLNRPISLEIKRTKCEILIEKKVPTLEYLIAGDIV